MDLQVQVFLTFLINYGIIVIVIMLIYGGVKYL